jgi:hypothetical protein
LAYSVVLKESAHSFHFSQINGLCTSFGHLQLREVILTIAPTVICGSRRRSVEQPLVVSTVILGVGHPT